jgi:hypothetical protein
MPSPLGIAGRHRNILKLRKSKKKITFGGRYQEQANSARNGTKAATRPPTQRAKRSIPTTFVVNDTQLTAGLRCHSGRLTTVERGMNVLALVKGSERYVFLYDDESAQSLLQTLGRYASDPDLSFTWYDAAILSQKIRRSRDEQPQRLPAQRFPETT